MFARITGVTLALVIALGVTAKTNPDSWVLHPDQWLASAVQHQATTGR